MVNLTELKTQKQRDAAEILEGALNGDRADQNRLIEGISTSDLPVQLIPALNQIVLNNYAEQPKIWNQWATKKTFDDFRESEYIQMAWDATDPDIETSTAGTPHYPGGLARIPEYGEYPVIRFEATGQGLKIHKNGVQIKLSWESIVNDRRFNLLRDIPGQFGKRSAIQEDVEATRPLLSDDNFSVANGNLGVGAEWALSAESLTAAFQAITQQTYNGNRVTLGGGYKLVVDSALVPVAEQILAVQSVETVVTDGSTETRTVSGNPLKGKFTIVENPYIVGLGGADTSWWLLPNPGTAPNENVINGFLSGHENPEIFVQKTTTGDPVDGAFIDDSYSTKVRHVVTGGFVRPEGTFEGRVA